MDVRFKFLTTLLVVIIVYPILFRFRTRLLFITFYIAQVLYHNIMSYYMYFHSYLHFNPFAANFYEDLLPCYRINAKKPVTADRIIDFPFFAYLAVTYRRANR